MSIMGDDEGNTDGVPLSITHGTPLVMLSSLSSHAIGIEGVSSDIKKDESRKNMRFAWPQG